MQQYRSWRSILRDLAARNDGSAQRVRGHFPTYAFILIETVFGLLGFPGLGWMISGQATVGMLILFLSPTIAWVLVPIIISVYHIDSQTMLGPTPILAYIIAATLLSVAGLGLSLWRYRRAENRK